MTKCLSVFCWTVEKTFSPSYTVDLPPPQATLAHLFFQFERLIENLGVPDQSASPVMLSLPLYAVCRDGLLLLILIQSILCFHFAAFIVTVYAFNTLPNAALAQRATFRMRGGKLYIYIYIYMA